MCVTTKVTKEVYTAITDVVDLVSNTGQLILYE